MARFSTSMTHLPLCYFTARRETRARLLDYDAQRQAAQTAFVSESMSKPQWCTAIAVMGRPDLPLRQRGSTRSLNCRYATTESGIETAAGSAIAPRRDGFNHLPSPPANCERRLRRDADPRDGGLIILPHPGDINLVHRIEGATWFAGDLSVPLLRAPAVAGFLCFDQVELGAVLRVTSMVAGSTNSSLCAIRSPRRRR
jgi:hypothetical protein